MVDILLTGAAGRMGQAVLSVLPGFKGVHLVAAIDEKGHPQIGKKVYKNVKLSSDLACHCEEQKRRSNPANSLVLIDFTTAGPSINNLKTAASSGIPVVLCTTGHDQDQRAEILSLSKIIPVVYSPNMSVGVNTMWKLIGDASAIFGKDYKIDIVETHHVHKKDAPSGTAKKMMEIIGAKLEAGSWKQDDGRQIQVRSIREGEVVGDHTISFTNKYETLEITHRAFSREVFAQGALRAAEWIMGKRPGLYNMEDVLDLCHCEER